jgi:hypothetical protein
MSDIVFDPSSLQGCHGTVENESGTLPDDALHADRGASRKPLGRVRRRRRQRGKIESGETLVHADKKPRDR